VLEGWSGFELDLDVLASVVPDELAYTDVVTFPEVRQDLAFAVSEDVTAAALVEAAREAAGVELRTMVPFDVYRGDQVGEGRKSIAFNVTFQSAERTLSDDDAAALRTTIVDALAARFGAELRA
jgi:phenylalanyl-tRNA synthetase beta chain